MSKATHKYKLVIDKTLEGCDECVFGVGMGDCEEIFPLDCTDHVDDENSYHWEEKIIPETTLIYKIEINHAEINKIIKDTTKQINSGELDIEEAETLISLEARDAIKIVFDREE